MRGSSDTMAWINAFTTQMQVKVFWLTWDNIKVIELFQFAHYESDEKNLKLYPEKKNEFSIKLNENFQIVLTL